jgi:transcriptional regulator NrdR family protein
MTCPVCKKKTKVVDSREMISGSVWRRRECLCCGYRFNTMEKPIKKEVHRDG